MIKADRFLGTRLARRIVLGVLLCAGAGQATADVGRTPGIFEVSSTGAATYTIPLWTPQGPNGMQPNLALTYDSGGANGVLGVGWSLSGLSSIERCSKNRSADAGFTGGPSLSAEFRVCLNGNKLRLDSGLPYGAPGTTYRTELHSFATITAYGGSTATGPDYFIMAGNDARTYEFGRTADSRVMAGTAVLRWKLNKVSDTAGNTYVVSYSPENGFAVPTTVSWTATGFGQSTYRHLARFNYSTNRSDTLSAKLSSQTLSNNRRLESIQIESSGTVIRKYVLTYDSGSVSHRSRLTAVKECANDAATQCLGETTITYQSGAMGVTSTAYPVVSGATSVQGENDFDGDGRQDLLFAVSGGWQVAFGTTTGFGTPQAIPTITASTFILTGRFATDGRDGVLASVGGSWRYYGWNGSSFSESANLVTSPAAGNNNDATDLDGDGLLDLVWRVGNQVFTRLNSTADGSSTPSFSGTSQVGATLTVIGQLESFVRSPRQDLDGDGRRDVVVMKSRQPPHIEEPIYYAIPLLSRGAVFEVGPEIYLGVTSGNIVFLNFNDDKCSDWISDRQLHISQCANTEPSAVTFTLPEETFVLDWDSDSRDDVLFNSGGNLAVYRSLGTSLDSVPIITSVPYAVGGYLPMDPNGDGVNDLIHSDAYAPNSVVLYKRSEIVDIDALTLAVPDLATKFTDGYGVSYEPQYTTTANSLVYTRGASAVDELREAPEPRVVVRTVTAPDGTGSTFQTKYSYVGARSDYWRSETVGFEQRTAIDTRNNLRRRTTFRQGFPFTGLIAKDELLKWDGTTLTLISETTNEYDSHSYGEYPIIGALGQFPFLHVSTTKRYDLENVLLATTTTTNTIDAASGGLVEQETKTVEAATAVNGVQPNVENKHKVHNTLFNASGCSGRPERTEETRSLTDGDPITRTTTTTWSSSHCRPTQVVVEPDAAQVQWRMTTALGYDDFGNVNQITQTPEAGQNQTQRVSAINWGTTGQFPHELINPELQSTVLVWDLGRGVPTEITEPNSAHTYLDYDDFGRLESETRPDQTRTAFALTGCSSANSYCSGPADFRFKLNASFYNSDNYTNPDRVDSQYFDAFERPRYSDVTLPDGAVSRTIVTYDALGRIATQTVPHKSGGPTGPTTFAYDLLNRLLSATRQAGELDTNPITTLIGYSGLQRQVTDAENKKRTLTYDAVGRVVRSKDAANATTAYEYDAFGNLLKVTDPLSNVVEMTYGVRGHKLTSKDPDMGEWRYEYFPFGELKSQKDAKEQIVYFEYDRLSRLKKRTEAPEGETTFVYDATTNAVGQLSSVSGPGGYSENYGYDAIGRLLNRRITISSTDYNYDFTYGVHGQLDTLTYPDTIGGRLAVQYSYAKGWLQQVAQGSTVFWHADTLNARGQVTKATLGNGVVRENVIDAITGLVKHIKSGPGGGYALQNESYLYDDVGNVTQRQNGNPSLVEDFYYDDLHRLDHSKLGGAPNLQMGYDALGNITSRSDIASGATWTYDASKKHAVTQAGPYTYAYDANGNAITRNNHEIKWTSYNLPYEINGPGKKLTFSYGPDRQRFRQVYQNGSTTETTLYLGGLLERVDAGGVTDWRHYIVADGEAVAIVSRKSSGTNATWYLLKDHLGSVAKILNSSGGEYASESFAAFGMRRDPTPWSGPCPCPDLDKIKSVSRRGYTEHEMIGGQSMGLIHMNGRVQDAVIGRFLSPDPFVQAPFNAQSLNRYSYVFNNPLSHTDPSGFLCADPNYKGPCFWVDGREEYYPINPDGNGDHALNGQTVPRTQMHGMVFSENSKLSDSTVGGTSWQDYHVASLVAGLEGDWGGFLSASLSMLGASWREAYSTPGNAFLTTLSFVPLVGVEASGARAGSIRGVNPGGVAAEGRRLNCVNCAVATDATLAGRPASALPSRFALPISFLEKHFGAKFSGVVTREWIMRYFGSRAGARGIIYGASKFPGQPGHVWNIVNQNGVVRVLDGQAGQEATHLFDIFDDFRILVTN